MITIVTLLIAFDIIVAVVFAALAIFAVCKVFKSLEKLFTNTNKN